MVINLNLLFNSQMVPKRANLGILQFRRPKKITVLKIGVQKIKGFWFKKNNRPKNRRPKNKRGTFGKSI